MNNPNLMLKTLIQNPQFAAIISLVARVLMAVIFIVAGWGKISAYAATVGYMASKGLPGGLLPLTILVELGGGLALLFGFQTRVVAALLAGFSLITALLFHATAEDSINFMKNLAMAGGFLLLMQQGAGCVSVDHVLEKHRVE